ncbi:MAG: folate family ECF transporter S component [Clostridiaceae bacterium]|nr:folate family ECF transporter S component [Clostridiaceae bacterium]
MSIIENLFNNLKNAFTNFFASIEKPLEVLVNYGLLITLFFLILFLVISIIKHKSSIKNIKNTKALVVCAMLLALNLIIKLFNVEIGNYLRLGFGFITLPIAAMLYGPFIGGLLGIVQDITYYIFHQTGPYLPLMGIGAIISGLIHGNILYNKKITWLKAAAAVILDLFIVNMTINTIAVYSIVDRAIYALFASRVLSSLLQVPIQTIIIYFILNRVKKINKL